jgi:hypothetical protein
MYFEIRVKIGQHLKFAYHMNLMIITFKETRPKVTSLKFG